MKEENEQGFLSHKFNDFGSEPIPNGWSDIEKQLAKDRRRKAPFWILGSGALLLVLSLVGIWFSNNLSHKSQIAQSTTQTKLSRSTVFEKSRVEGGQFSTDEPNGGSDLSHAKASSPVIDEQNSIDSYGSQIHKDDPSIRKTPSLANSKMQSEAIVASQSSGKVESFKSAKKRLPTALIVANAKAKQPSTASGFKSGKRRRKADDPIRKDIEMGHDLPSETLLVRNEQGENEWMSEFEAKSTSVLKQPIEYLDLKTAHLILGLDPQVESPQLVEILRVENRSDLDSNLAKKKQSRALSMWGGASIAYAQKTIAVNQANAVNHVIVGSSFDSRPSWLAQISGSLLYEMPSLSWLQLVAGFSFGFYQQNIGLLSLDREPTGYTVKEKDSLNYSINPSWLVLEENRMQQLLFANFELGIRPLISKWGKSGPFATVQIWTRLSENRSSSLVRGTAFVSPKSSVAFGYRVGYQYLLSEKWQAEIFSGPIPQQLISTTSGISIKPQFFGIGFNRMIW